MNWQTVYQIDGSGDGSSFLPFLYVGLGALLLALVLYLRARAAKRGRGTPTVVAIFGVLVAGLGYGMNTWDQGRLARMLASGEVLSVEGPVSAHQVWREDITNPKKDIGRRYRTWETITVGTTSFIWSPGAVEPAFTNAQLPPVAFRDGLMVRVTYVEDVAGEAHQRRILRLETGPDAPVGALPGAPFPSLAPGGHLPSR
ncbi:MAG: hypothetical protein KF710_07135 [Rhodocyclaceae bacterium]|nr:hypothetical protein [Rhodocyclaceae bacterium]